MKKKILLMISATLVLGLAIATYSYGTAGSVSTAAAACCCCSGDSCPMKKKDRSGKETASCCDADCCKGGAESCPMMKKDASGKMEHSDCPMMKKDASAAASTTMDMHDMKSMHGDMKAMHGDGSSCCHGDSCPMKKKDASGKEVSACDGCDCCKGASNATTKTVSYYFKGQPVYTTGKSSCTCCGAKKDSQKS